MVDTTGIGRAVAGDRQTMLRCGHLTAIREGSVFLALSVLVCAGLLQIPMDEAVAARNQGVTYFRTAMCEANV